MAGEALNLTANSGRAWLRESTRAAILKAARELFDEGGVEALSLGAVATQTGFAPPTVYAYFTTKNELLVATVANDLAALAQAMRDVYPFAQSPTIEPVSYPSAVSEEVAADTFPIEEIAATAEPLAVPVVQTTAPAQDEQSEPQLFDSLPEEKSEAAPLSSFAMNFPVVGKKRRLLERREPAPETAPEVSEAPALMPHPDRVQDTDEPVPVASEPVAADGELASLKESVAKLETRKVDAWLERRLRIFEKTLNDIESRLAASEQGSTRAVALSDETAKSVVQRFDAAEKRLRDGLDSLAQRLENSEKRPRGIPPDLRATINDLYARLETLESGHSAVPANLETQWSAAPSDTSLAPDVAPDEAEKPITAAAETYLTAARRAASAAAQLAEIDNKPSHFVAISRKRWSRTNLMLALCGALALLLVVYGFILRDYFFEPDQQTTPVANVHLAPAKPLLSVDRVATLANQGNPNGELLLGLDYLNGSGVAKNPVQAARWLQLSAEGGEAVGQYWFGTLYERGFGVTADPAQAFHWYQTAAMQGNRRAIYNVAIAYAVGRGTARDMAQAASWFKRAAELGYVDAQYNLAVLYERGQGVPQSLNDAYKWYAIAAAAGDKDSTARITALSSQLKPEDLSAAQSAAASFKPELLNKAANLLPAIPAHA